MKPGTDETVEFSELCHTGGIANAYEAVKLASTLKAETKNEKEVSVETKDEKE